MRFAAILASLAAVFFLSSCQSDQTPPPEAYTPPVENPYGENGYPSPYGSPPPGPYPQSADYVDVSPVSEDIYAGAEAIPAGPVVGYQPPSYGSEPTYTPPAPPAPPKPQVIASATQDASYQVVRGDTLYSISRRYGTTVNNLKQVNALTSDTIRPGDVLAIP